MDREQLVSIREIVARALAAEGWNVIGSGGMLDGSEADISAEKSGDVISVRLAPDRQFGDIPF
jgi:hypothetical protein